MDWNGWISWILGSLSAVGHWAEAHPGTASWLQAVGSIAAIVFVYVLAAFQFRRSKSHQDIDRTRRAQGLALLLIPVLDAFKPKLEAAMLYESKLSPPDGVIRLLDQLYILGVAGGFVLQMVAELEACERAEPPAVDDDGARLSYNLMTRQRLEGALRCCEDAINALWKLARARTV